MKSLLLMRHAKSDWEADYAVDHDRPLNERGIRSAGIMGRLLTSLDLAPNFLMSSSAVRARDTANLAREAGGWDVEVLEVPELYGADPEGVLQIAATAPNVDRLMLVGHQPTWSLVAGRLTEDVVDMRTATVAVVLCDVGSWAEVRQGIGRLVDVHQPRDHFDTDLDV